MTQYRIHPKPLYQQRLFINQRNEEFTRHGIYRICRKYLSIALSAKRLKQINPVHSFRHSCALECLPAATPSLKSKIIWASIKLNPPWCISNWIWQEKNTSRNNLSSTHNRFYPMIQTSINSSIGKTKKILWTGSTASKRVGLGSVLKSLTSNRKTIRNEEEKNGKKFGSQHRFRNMESIKSTRINLVGSLPR